MPCILLLLLAAGAPAPWAGFVGVVVALGWMLLRRSEGGFDLFGPNLAFSVAYLGYFGLGSFSTDGGVLRFDPLSPGTVALGLASYWLGAGLVSVSPDSARRLDSRALARAGLTYAVYLGVALLAVAWILYRHGLPLLEIDSRHSLGGYSTQLASLGWIGFVGFAAVWFGSGRVVSPLFLLLGAVPILLLVLLAFRSPVLGAVMAVLVVYNYQRERLRARTVAAVLAILVTFATAAGYYRYQRSQLFGHTYESLLERTGLDAFGPVGRTLAPLLWTVREGPLVLDLLQQNVHEPTGGQVLFSTVETLLPGKQLGPREWVGVLARGYVHSNTPTIVGFPWVDFGARGVVAFLALFGALSAWLHDRAARRKSVPWSAVYGCWLATLLLNIHAGVCDLYVLISPAMLVLFLGLVRLLPEVEGKVLRGWLTSARASMRPGIVATAVACALGTVMVGAIQPNHEAKAALEIGRFGEGTSIEAGPYLAELLQSQYNIEARVAISTAPDPTKAPQYLELRASRTNAEEATRVLENATAELVERHRLLLQQIDENSVLSLDATGAGPTATRSIADVRVRSRLKNAVFGGLALGLFVGLMAVILGMPVWPLRRWLSTLRPVLRLGPVPAIAGLIVGLTAFAAWPSYYRSVLLVEIGTSFVAEPIEMPSVVIERIKVLSEAWAQRGLRFRVAPAKFDPQHYLELVVDAGDPGVLEGYWAMLSSELEAAHRPLEFAANSNIAPEGTRAGRTFKAVSDLDSDEARVDAMEALSVGIALDRPARQRVYVLEPPKRSSRDTGPGLLALAALLTAAVVVTARGRRLTTGHPNWEFADVPSGTPGLRVAAVVLLLGGGVGFAVAWNNPSYEGRIVFRGAAVGTRGMVEPNEVTAAKLEAAFRKRGPSGAQLEARAIRGLPPESIPVGLIEVTFRSEETKDLIQGVEALVGEEMAGLNKIYQEERARVESVLAESERVYEDVLMRPDDVREPELMVRIAKDILYLRIRTSPARTFPAQQIGETSLRPTRPARGLMLSSLLGAVGSGLLFALGSVLLLRRSGRLTSATAAGDGRG